MTRVARVGSDTRLGLGPVALAFLSLWQRESFASRRQHFMSTGDGLKGELPKLTGASHQDPVLIVACTVC